MNDMKFRVRMSIAGDTAEIRVGSEIGDSWWGDSINANEFADMVAQLGPVALINLIVNSPGGDVFDASAMTETLKRNAADVHVYVDGLMASAATFFLDAADEVIVGENSTIVIHDAWSGVLGNAADMRKQADILDKLSGQIAELYARRAGGTADAWRELMLEETWFTAQEAVDAGLADRVAADLTEEPEDRAVALFHGRPAAHDPLKIVAALTDARPVTITSRPVKAEIAPESPASETQPTRKGNPMADTITTEAPESQKVNENAIDKLLEARFNAQKGDIQALIEAIKPEPAPSVSDILAALKGEQESSKKDGMTVERFASLVSARRRGSASAEEVAELTASYSKADTVFNAFQYASGGQNAMPTQWIDELVAKVPWSPVVYDLVGHEDLTGPTVVGYTATTLPAGGDYAGGGAVITSTAPVYAPEQLTASRYALAAGLDRINWDFGQEASLVKSFLRYGLSDYRKWLDAKIITNIMGSSTGFFGALSGTAATKAPANSVITDALNKILDGIVNVFTQGGGLANFGLLTGADYKAVAKTSWEQGSPYFNIDLAQLTQGEVASKFAVRPDITATLSAGDALVGNGLAGMTTYELPGSPIRVEQVVTATGTIDTGVFGYAAPFRENANYFSLVTSVATS